MMIRLQYAILFNMNTARTALLFLTTTLAWADTYPRQTGVDAVHYVFRLELTDASDVIRGDADILLRFVSPGVTEVFLDLTSAANGKGMTVSEVRDSAGALPFTHRANRLSIALAKPPEPGEVRRFTVRYQGIPATGLRIGANKYGERTFFSENWPDHARQWLPMIDHPYDKATSEFIVTAPAIYQVVSNGLLQEETDLGDGRRLTHWKQSVPIASWLNAIGVAQFTSRHLDKVLGIPLETWVFHQDREAGIIAFDSAARRSLEFFGTHIGPYAYEKLGNVEAAGLNGGTEHASAIFYGEKSINGKPVDGLVAHEIAHQWFGDAVTEKDWDDVWLSEGFATYFTLLFTEHDRGRDAFVADLDRSRRGIFALEAKNPGMAVTHVNLSDMHKVLNRIIYEKGGWTLHMLRGMMGTEKFWAGIREYYARYRDASASTADFRQVMEKHAGVELTWFFDQWLRRAGSPAIKGGWRYNAQAGRIEIELAQTQAGEPYRLPVEFSVSPGDGSPANIERVEMHDRQHMFFIKAQKEPAEVKIDPHTWLLAQMTFAKR